VRFSPRRILARFFNAVYQRKTPFMASGLYQYGVGGNEAKADSSEAIHEISGNKTIIAQKLTADEPLSPDIVEGLSTVEAVFAHFKPQVDVGFEDEGGNTIREELRYGNLGDFSAKKITENSPFLSDLAAQKEQYARITKQLKSNKVLRTMLENPETRQAFIQSLQALATELEGEK